MEEENKNLEAEEPTEVLGNTGVMEPVVETPTEPVVETPAEPVTETAPVEEAPVPQEAPVEQPVEQPTVEPVASAPTPEEPKKEEKKGSNKLLIIVALLVLVLGGGYAVWAFVLGGNKPKTEPKKEEEQKEEEKKPEEDKEESKPEESTSEVEIYTSKYKDLSDSEIYDKIQNNNEYIYKTDINGNDDNVVIKTFEFLTDRYSHFISSTESKDLKIDKCKNLHYFNINKNDLNIEVVCLSDVDISEVFLHNTDIEDHKNPPIAFVIKNEDVNTIKEYYPSAKLEKIKDFCGTKYTAEECESDYIVAYAGLTVNSNEKSFDITKITKKGSDYKATITSYRKYNTIKSPTDEPYEVVDKETFVFNVTVANGHVVFGTVE